MFYILGGDELVDDFDDIMDDSEPTVPESLDEDIEKGADAESYDSLDDDDNSNNDDEESEDSLDDDSGDGSDDDSSDEESD